MLSYHLRIHVIDFAHVYYFAHILLCEIDYAGK